MNYLDSGVPKLQDHCIVFYDQVLESSRFIKKLKIKNSALSFFPLEAGEELKQLGNIEKLYEEIFPKLDEVKASKPCFVAIGGGSLGDFIGFFASIYLRGVDLIHIPSTWLAAVDSSHGGKTAVNLKTGKNLMGSFHPAKETYICYDLLNAAPRELVEDAYFEFIKMFIIEGKDDFLMDDFYSSSVLDTKFLWKHLKFAVDAKYSLVQKDPFESIGDRRLLNLGHSFGHILEKHFGLSHGFAVGLGIDFSLRLSISMNFLTGVRASELLFHFDELGLYEYNRGLQKSISDGEIKKLLTRDKKRKSSDSIHFILVDSEKVIQKSLKHDFLIKRWRDIYA